MHINSVLDLRFANTTPRTPPLCIFVSQQLHSAEERQARQASGTLILARIVNEEQRGADGIRKAMAW